MAYLESDEVHDGIPISFMDPVSISSIDLWVIRPSSVTKHTIPRCTIMHSCFGTNNMIFPHLRYVLYGHLSLWLASMFMVNSACGP